MIELGLDTFGDVTMDASGRPLTQAEVLRHVVDEGELADQVGLDFFGVGEHHRPDFSVSAPEVVLAAIAARSTRIRLGSAVTVLSSDDPVRVYQRFSTVNAISSGRAEVILGRGSFTESFPLFGYDLADCDELLHSPGHVAATDDQAREELWPHYAGLMNRIGAERGWPPIGRAHFENEAGPDGSLYVGSPDTVAAKIVRTIKVLGLSRFDLKYSNGTLPHDQMMSSIELYGTRVVPRVREQLA